MVKKLLLLMIAIGVLVPCIILVSKLMSAKLVYDRYPDYQRKTKFRYLPGLNMSVSGQITSDDLLKLIYENKKFIVVDLRQEPHAFINGEPVSWYKNYNDINKNKSVEKITYEEFKLIEDIKSSHEVKVWIPKKIQSGIIETKNYKMFKVILAQSEEEFLSNIGIGYKRFLIQDHHSPNLESMDDYINFFAKVHKENVWVHAHCRGGCGRSTLFGVMYDIYLNNKISTLDEILFNHKKYGGADLVETNKSGDKAWKNQPAADRLNFIKSFYRLCKNIGTPNNI